MMKSTAERAGYGEWKWSAMVLIVLGLGALLPAQDEDARARGERLLREAEVAWRAEQDLGAAERLFRSVVADREIPAELRTKAWLILGKCLVAQGDDDGAEEAFRLAAEGVGPAAREAGEVLSGRASADEKLAAQVRRLIKELRSGVAHSFESLVELGEAAVPYVIDELERETQREQIETFARALLAIGTDGAAAYVEGVARSNDVYLQKVLLSEARGFYGPGGTSLSRTIQRAFIPLLEAEDAGTRERVRSIVRSSLRPDELVRLARGEDAGSRDLALREIVETGHLLDAEVAAAVADTLFALLDSPAPADREVAEELLGESALVRSRVGQRFFLAALERGFDVNLDADVTQTALREVGGFRADDLLSAAEGLAARTETPELRRARTDLANAVRLSSGHWSRESFGAALELLRRGYGGYLEQWVLQIASSEDAPRVAAALGSFEQSLLNAVNWLAEQPLDGEALEAIGEALDDGALRERLRETRSEAGVMICGRSRAPVRGRRTSSADEILFEAVANAPHAESKRVLRRVLELDGARSAPALAVAVTASARFDGELGVELLRRLDDHPVARQDLLARLATHGTFDPAVLEAAALEHVGESYFRLLLAGESGEGVNKYPLETSARIVAAALNETAPVNWKALGDLLLQPTGLGSQFVIPEPIARVLYERALENRTDRRSQLIGKLFVMSGPYDAMKIDLRRRIVEGGEPASLIATAVAYSPHDPEGVDWLRPLLAHPNDGVALQALERFSVARGEEYAAWLEPCFQHAVAEVRARAVALSYDLAGDAAIETILPFAEDGDGAVRQSVCDTLGRSTDPRAADALIERLRDGSASVRASAQKALERIEDYVSRRRRWDSLKEEYALEADSAAEELLRQTRESEPKKIRLAAIRSLGALGVAETLPFVIRLMLDEDEEIADASSTAVEQIQARLSVAPPPAPAPRPNPSAEEPREATPFRPPTRSPGRDGRARNREESD